MSGDGDSSPLALACYEELSESAPALPAHPGSPPLPGNTPSQTGALTSNKYFKFF